MLSEATKRYRLRNGIPLDAPLYCRKIRRKVREYTWEGETLREEEWAKRLGIGVPAFRWRVRKYGPEDERTFVHKKDALMRRLKAHAWPARDKALVEGRGRGNEEWRALGK